MQHHTDQDDFFKVLKTHTAPAHKALEALPLSRAIVSPSLSLSDYAAYLHRMQAFVGPFEQRVFPALSTIFTDLPQRHKSGWLAADLDHLASKGVSERAPAAAQISAGPSALYDAGRLYVIEGSTLGGKFIYKNVSASLGLYEARGATYFNGYGTATGPMWTGFMAQLGRLAASPEADQNEIVRGAGDAFKMLYDLLK